MGEEETYEYEGEQPHAVTEVGDDEYVYDDNGNMIARFENGITYRQEWNAYNKLASVDWRVAGVPCRTEFVYDGDGNRLLKIENMLSQFGPSGNMERVTLYIGNMYERQFNTTGSPVGARVEGMIPEGVDPMTACKGGSDSPTDYGFTGQRNEGGFGLMDFNARMYSPRLGRFASPDSIVPEPSSSAGFNRYRYARNSPLVFSDPTGHFSEEQLSEWYGENWQDNFSAEWQKLLLDNPDSPILGAQLGDLVAFGNLSEELTNAILVLNDQNQLALWNTQSKQSTALTQVGNTSPDRLGLYRVIGNGTGQPFTRFDNLFDDTPLYLPATNGGWYGPHDTALVGEYSPRIDGLSPTESVAADWFIGNVDEGQFVSNSIEFDSFSPGSTASAYSYASSVGGISLSICLTKT